MTLEDRIREAHRTGRLTDLSVRRTRKGFQANYMAVQGEGHRVAMADDPVEALVEALTPALDDEPSEEIEDVLS